jgi:PAS domain S-box-containing protein
MIADYEICDKNGKIILVEIGINPVRNEAGEFLFYMGFCRDVTENRKARQALMESENRYKLLADNIKDVIWTADLNLCTTYISPSVYALEGYKPEERKAKLMKEILTPESYSFVTDLMKNILLNYAEGKAGLRDEFAIFEVEIIRKNGSTFWAEVNASLMFDAEGNAFGINGVTRDITDRKETESALRISEQKLKELNATKDKFFSIIAHDLRNPFSSILGFSKELAENYDQFSDNERIALLHQINSAANGTNQLLANLLEWSMAQSGRMEAIAETILISNLANEAIIELSGQAMRKKIILISRIASDIQAFADKGMIRTVLRNLISNAIKFTPSGGTITIESCYEQSMVKVWISDTGVGMSESSIDKLFRIEEKVISKGTEGEKGNGLGLILCKNFIDQNGGRIWAVSSKLKGSIFYFTLPVKQTV